MNDLIKLAIDIANKAHENQKDKNGAPYILHVMRVGLKGKSDEEKICGFLHDVVEDSETSFDDLRKFGFPEDIISALICLTKKTEDEPYQEFIDRIKKNPLAIKVKLNDLEDNMDIKRLNSIGEKEVVRLNKYLKAYTELHK